jgi:hypothetical protein
MDNIRRVVIWIVVLILVLAFGYFVFSTGVLTGNVVNDDEETIENEEILPKIYGKSSPFNEEGDLIVSGFG